MVILDRLVHYCAHVDIEENVAEEIKGIISSDLNWAYFLQKSKDEGVSGSIYKSLSKIQGIEKIVPKNILQSLKDIYCLIIGRNILISQTLEKILVAFEKENIPAIVFKGITLAETVYGDIGLRSMTDLDILVKRQDIKKADEILESFNYTKPPELKDFSIAPFSLYTNSFLYSNLLSTCPKYIHLHWHIINTPIPAYSYGNIDIDKIWQEAVPFKTYNNIYIMSTHHQLIYLCEHALKHSYYRLILLYDIDMFIRYYQGNLNWNKVVSDAREFNLTRSVYYTLYFVKRILDSPVPDFVLSVLKPKRFIFLERRFIKAVINGRRKDGMSYIVYLAMNRTLFDKIRFIRMIFFPAPDAMKQLNNLGTLRVKPFHYLLRIYKGFAYSLKVAQSLII